LHGFIAFSFCIYIGAISVCIVGKKYDVPHKEYCPGKRKMGSTETRRMDSDEFYPLMGDIRSACDACTLLK
jgi:hypothetical protein